MLPSGMRKESGTCNVCSAPCSSCMHRIASVSESNVKHNCKREESCTSFNCAKSRAFYDAQHVASEASNLLSASSSQNSYSDSVEGQSVLRPSVVYEASEAVDMPLKFSESEKIGENRQFRGKPSHSVFESHQSTENPMSMNAEFEQTSQIRNNLSSQALENENNCFEVAAEFDGLDETERCNENNELEKQSPTPEESNTQEFQIQAQSHPTADLENGLIDVNVCDICGDIGREALLATCSRCTDGAEHIYCMRVKLDKVPEGDWICGQCEEKTEKKKNYNVVSISNNSEWSQKMDQKPESSPKPQSSVNLGAKEVGSKACASLKVKQNSFKLHKHAISSDTVPAIVKELSETSNGLMVSPNRGKSPTFSCSRSFKGMGMVKPKSNCTISSPRVQPRSSFQQLSRTSSTGSVPIKSHKELSSPKVLSKQVSFDISKIRLKDKLLVEGQAQKLVRESTPNGTIKEVRPIAKSASFKSMNSSSPRTLLVNKAQVPKSLRLEDRDTSVDKIQPLMSSRLEDGTGIRPKKEKIKIGRHDDTFPCRSIVSLSPVARVRPLKVEQKTTTFDGKVHNKADLTPLSTSRTFNNAKGLKCEEGKVQNSSNTNIYKTSISENKRPNVNAIIAVKGSFKANKHTNRSKVDYEKGLKKPATKTLNLSDSACTGDKSKNSISGSPKKASTPSHKEIGFHKGNDASHTTKFCTTQRPTDADEGTSRVGMLKDVLKNKMKNSKLLEQIEECTSHTPKFCTTQRPTDVPTDVPEGTSRGGRLKDVFQTVIQKNKMKKNSRLLEQTEECTMTSNNLIRTVALASSLNSKSQKKMHTKDACNWQQKMTSPASDSSKTEADFAMKQEKDLVEASCFSRLANMDSNAAIPEKLIPDELHVDISAQLVPAQPLVSRGGRLKDVFQTVIQKNKMKKNSRLLEQTKECTTTSSNLICTVALASSLNSKSQKNMHTKDACNWQQKMTSPASDSSKTDADFAMKQEKDLVEASCFSSLANMDSNAAIPEKLIADELHVDISAQLVPAQPLVSCSAAASVIPQPEFIWQGSFEILSEGKSLRLVDGVQAHLASFVSPKVLEVVRHIPTNIQLNEIPRVKVWPLQFLETSPTEESIALYFFAKDAHSYERSYVKLLDWVLTNDMALIGIINEVELLIFPSNKLPDNSQRWNMLHFLWGVFRASTENSSQPPSDLHEEFCSSKLPRNLLSLPACGTSTIQKIDSDNNPDRENIRIEEIPGSTAIEENSSNVVKFEEPTHVSEVQQQRFCGPPKCFNASKLEESAGLEESSCQEETRLVDASVKPEVVLDEHIVESDNLIWPLKPSLKRSYSCLSATDSKASKVFTRSGFWHEKHATFSEEDDKKVKRIKFHNEGHKISTSRDPAIGRNPLAKVFHLFGNVVEQLPTDTYSENLPFEFANCIQDLRLLDPSILKSNIENSPGSIRSSEAEETPIADSPDLELSLGAPKRMLKKVIPPVLLSVADRSKHISSGALADDENITLSLASPGTVRI